MPSRRVLAVLALTVAYAAAIFVLSSFPVPPPAEEAVAALGDKTLHAIEYAGLALLLALAFGAAKPEWRWQAALLALAAAALYAASDEFHQAFVPGRVADILDWLADSAGAAIGAAAGWVLLGRATVRAALVGTRR